MSVQGSDNPNLDEIEARELARLGTLTTADYRSRTVLALVAEVQWLRQENERLLQEAWDWHDKWSCVKAERDAARAEVEQLRARIAAVEALCNVVRASQEPDPHTGDRMVSFFGLLDALDADDSVAVPETTGAGDA